MRLGVSSKYALWFGALSLVILSTVLLATGLVIWKRSEMLAERLRQETQQNYETLQQQTMLNVAEFLRRELFTPLYDLNIEYVERTLKDLQQGMPVISARIADATGKILTDGTDENRSFGMQLPIDTARLASSPVLIERLEPGQRVTFSISINEYLAGYGEIVFSDQPLKKAIREQDETISLILMDAGQRLLEIGLVSALLVAFLAGAISLVFSRTLTLPLIRLRNAASRIARGELSFRVQVISNDEVGELAAAFNDMGAKLQKRAEEVELANRALQAEIVERTEKEKALRESEERLITAKNAAEAANRAKSDFLANMSHEMRTPLAGALGMINLVLEMELGHEERQMLDMSKRSAESLLRLISDLLDFSRLEAGMLAFEKKPFSIALTVASAIEVVAIQAREKGLQLSWNFEDSVPEQAQGDEGRLRQVLINLLGNAVKFTERGEVALAVSRFCDLEQPGHETLLFSIRDTGIGIPAEQTESIFEKFVQVEPTRRRKYGGTGLGLALSRQIVEMIGGRIWVYSRLGRGSTFYFTCPVDMAPKEIQL